MGHFYQKKMDHEHHGGGVVVLACCDILGEGMRKQVGDNRTTKKNWKDPWVHTMQKFKKISTKPPNS